MTTSAFGTGRTRALHRRHRENGRTLSERSNRRITSANCARGEVARSQYPRCTARRFSNPWSRVSSTRPPAAILANSASSRSF